MDMLKKLLILGVLVLTACGGRSAQPPGLSVPTPIETPTSLALAAPLPPSAIPVTPTSTPSPVPSPLPPSPTAPPIEALNFPDTSQYTWRPLAEGLNRPVDITHAGDGSDRLFVIEQIGMIRIIQEGVLLDTPFLDIRDRVGSDSNEQGLLGLAFHPNYADTGRLFVNYTDKSGNTVIARFHADPAQPNLADVSSETVLLKIDQPYPNHNGGELAFGKDGYLYLGLGDGGSAGDPQNNAQALDVLLGKILRIDINQGELYTTPTENIFAQGQQPEIWAYGLRNPWRFSFDRLTGDLYIGDVGQNQWEEIDFLPAGHPAGANFGWRYLEGSHPFSEQSPPADLELIGPIAEYDHSQGCAVTGGIVYRGSEMPEWNGIYVFADYCSGTITGLLQDTQGGWLQQDLFQNIGLIASFGEDEQGEIYLADHAGRILRLEGNSPPTTQPVNSGVPLTAGDSQPSDGGLNHYQISLALDYPKPAFKGTLQFTMTNREVVPLDQLYFRLIPNGGRSYGDGSLTVTETQLNGAPVETRLSKENTVLEIPLDVALQPGEQAMLNFDFSGSVPENYGSDPTGYGIYNQTDGVLALAGWYPILAVYDEDGWNLDMPSAIGDSVYSDSASYSVEVTAPQDLVIAASGSQVERTADGDDYRYRFETRPARDFFLAASPDFSVLEQSIDGVKINAYYLPDHAQAAQQALQVAVDSLHTYNQSFGAYPYSELDVVEAPMKNAAGVEFPGIVLIGSFLYDNPSRQLFDIATAHEVAHQWWYNVVGNDVFEDPWLDEALTTFSSSLYFEESGRQAAADEIRANWQSSVAALIQNGLDDKVAQSLQHFENSPDPRIYGTVVYTKGALFFQKLREEIGDKAFFEALQNYYRDHQFEVAKPEDLLNTFEKSAGKELDEIFKEWLYTAQG